MTSQGQDLGEFKQHAEQLISLLGQEAGILARSSPTPRTARIMAEIEHLTLLLEAFNRRLGSVSDTAVRQMLERPNVERSERNTRPDIADDDDAARI